MEHQESVAARVVNERGTREMAGRTCTQQGVGVRIDEGQHFGSCACHRSRTTRRHVIACDHKLNTRAELMVTQDSHVHRRDTLRSSKTYQRHGRSPPRERPMRVDAPCALWGDEHLVQEVGRDFARINA